MPNFNYTPSPQTVVTIEQNAKGSWRVHLKKGPGVVYPQRHPELLSTEADALAKELRDAAEQCRRRNAPAGRKWP